MPMPPISKAGLAADTRGAVLIVGIVLGAILAGALFYLASVGDAILWREGVQDAADAAAFESAVWNARGMNAIVSINIVMSMVLSVLVIWRIVMIAIAAAIGISALLCTVGIGCAPAASLAQIEIAMLRADPRVADAIIRVLSGINVVEMGVASVVPVLGTGFATANTKLAYADATPFAVSASLLPNVNLQGIYNATTCLAGSGKSDGPGAGPEKPGGGSGGVDLTKPGGGSGGGSGGVDLTKPGGGSGGVDMRKPADDPCDPGGGSSRKPPGGKPPRDGSGGAGGNDPPAQSGSGAGGQSGGGSASGGSAGGPAPDPLQSASEWQNFVSMRMGMPVSLPVQDGDYSLLCNKAAAFPLNNLAGAIEKALVAAGLSQTLANFAVFPVDLQRNLLGVTAELLTGVFCAPLGTAPVSLSKILDKSFKAVCAMEFEKSGKKKPASGGDGGDSGASGGVDLGKDEPKFLDEDGVARTKKDWIDNCAHKQKVDMNKQLDGGLCAAEKALPEIECGKPAQVWDWSPNGSVFLRSFAVAKKPIATRFTDRGIDVVDGAREGNVTAVEGQAANAHAEMYFECEGKCTAAMWTIRWRARLRRVQPMQELLAASAAAALSGQIQQALKGLVSIDPVNDAVAKLPGPWIKLSEFRPVTALIEKVSGIIGDKLGFISAAHGALGGAVLDAFGSGFDGPTTVGDLHGTLHMDERPPPRGEDELRRFIRSHADRSATIH